MRRFSVGRVSAVSCLAATSIGVQAQSTDPIGPSAFDTVPVPVRKTPYDGRWLNALASGIAETHPFVVHARSLDGMDRIRWVNHAVNAAVRFRDDARGAQRDRWSTVLETLSSGAGDCEDFAIAKLHILLASGVRRSDLFLVIGNDLVRRSAHAVLMARIGGAFWVLDNNRVDPVPARFYRDFAPVISLAGDGRWVHGYAAGSVPARFAEYAAQRPFRPASGGDALASVVAAQSRPVSED